MPPPRLTTSNRLESLVDALARVVSHPLPHPLMQEVIVVQSSGMARWISTELARRLGVWANARYPFPNSFLDEIARACPPAEGSPEVAGAGDPGRLSADTAFHPDVAVWRLMALLGAERPEGVFAPLERYLRDDRDGTKRYRLAARIADLFDRYSVFRPDVLLGWQEEGPAENWQAALWRSLARGREDGHRAARQRALVDHLRAGTFDRALLPTRVAVFGIPTLPPFHLEVLDALGAHTEVHLFHLSPCSEFWADIVSDREADRRARVRGTAGPRPAADDLHLERGHPLLSSLGTLARRYFELLLDLECEETSSYEEPGEETVLEALQSDILHLRDPRDPSYRRRVIQDGDTSLQIHSAHGPMREIEVLRDQLLFLLESHPELEPRDIVVMTPDVGAYAPYIDAVFGAVSEERADGPPKIPYTIAEGPRAADRSAMEAFLLFLQLADSRLQASRVVELVENPAVRRRFGLLEDDLQLVRRWIERCRIHWGVDGEDRTRHGLPGAEENTWRAGLDRLLLGYALPGEGERLFRGICPFDYVEGADAAVLGRFVMFAETVFEWSARLRVRRPLREWADTLSALCAALISREPSDEGGAGVVEAALAGLGAAHETAPSGEILELGVVRDHLERVLARESHGAAFPGTGVTFSTLLPMRSIPFEVVCLVGMDDGAFPRPDTPPEFDLMASCPRPGDRSRLEEDRYLFLEALLSARRSFYLSYVGKHIRDNTAIPPSVLVTEVLDTVAQSFEVPTGEEVSERLVTHHRLQAFHPDYFRGVRGLVSYSSEALAASRALIERDAATAATPFFATGLRGAPEELLTVTVEDLAAFLTHPSRYILRSRLLVYLDDRFGMLSDDELYEISDLERYELQQRLVEWALEGRSSDEFYPLRRAQGCLPHGAVGQVTFASRAEEVEEFLRRLSSYRGGARRPPLRVEWEHGGVHLIGKLSDVWENAAICHRCASLSAKDRLRGWVHHLALQVARGEGDPRETIVVSRDRASRFRSVVQPGEHLDTLLELYQRGLTRPLPFFPEASLAYVEEIRKSSPRAQPLNVARSRWAPSARWGKKPPERDDPYFARCFGDHDPIGEEFARVAEAIAGPLVDSEEKI